MKIPVTIIISIRSHDLQLDFGAFFFLINLVKIKSENMLNSAGVCFFLSIYLSLF